MKYLLYILSWAGALLWSFAFMVGLNYIIDNIAASIVLAILLAAILGGAVTLMVNKSRNKDKVSGNTVKISLAAYIVASVASCVFVNQFVYVESTLKDEIRKEARGQVDELLTAYGENAGSYNEWVLNRQADYRTYLEGRMSPGSVETKINEFQDTFLDSSYGERANKDMSDMYIIHDNIDTPLWLDIAFSLDYLKRNKGLWEEQLAEASHRAGMFMPLSSDEYYNPGSEYNNYEVFDSLSSIGFSFWSILVVILLQLMMLLVYLVTKPDHGHGATKYGSEGVGTLSSWSSLPPLGSDGDR